MKLLYVLSSFWLFGLVSGCSTYEVAECSQNTDCKSDEYCDDDKECKNKPISGSSGNGATSGGGTADCGAISDCESCALCADDNSCSPEKAACLQSQACTGVIACVNDCGGSSLCQEQCVDLFPGGLEIAYAWTSCKYCTVCYAQCTQAYCGE